MGAKVKLRRETYEKGNKNSVRSAPGTITLPHRRLLLLDTNSVADKIKGRVTRRQHDI